MIYIHTYVISSLIHFPTFSSSLHFTRYRRVSKNLRVGYIAQICDTPLDGKGILYICSIQRNRVQEKEKEVRNGIARLSGKSPRVYVGLHTFSFRCTFDHAERVGRTHFFFFKFLIESCSSFRHFFMSVWRKQFLNVCEKWEKDRRNIPRSGDASDVYVHAQIVDLYIIIIIRLFASSSLPTFFDVQNQ